MYKEVKESNVIKEMNTRTGRIQYRVKGTDGWDLVTNSKSIADAYNRSSNKDFGRNRVCR